MNWFHKIFHTKMNLRTTVLASFLVCLSVIVFEQSKFGDILENEIALGSSYQFRSKIGRDPDLSSRLKVFFFDDKAFATVGRPSFTTDEWLKVFKSLDERKPKAILVDKIFSFPSGDIDSILRAGTDIQTKIYTASFSTPTKIPGRHPVDDSPSLSYKDPIFQNVDFEVKGSKPYIYGASKELRKFFSGTGQVEYRNQSHVPGYIKAGKNSVLLHISASAAESYSAEENVLVANGKRIRLDRRGRVLVNHGTKEALAKNSYGMSPLYLRATKTKRPISVVNEGDIVLLLPGMYTGGSDWHRTLLGTMPGGTLIAAMVNSVLTGRHLYKWDWGRPFFVVTGALLGLGLGAFLGGGFFWVGFAFVLICVPLVGMLSFAYFSWFVPWFYPLASFGATSLLAMGQKTSALRNQKIRMEAELETAHAVQKHFIKDGEFVGKHFVSYGLFLGASECSGDWLFKISNHKYDFLFLGDVMGHGISAALVTSLASSIVRSEIVHEGASLEGIAKTINRVMYATFSGKISMSLTAFAFFHDRKSVEILNAGHTFPILIEKGKAKTIRVTGSLLGVSVATNFQTKIFEFQQGQRLFTYTDGLIESQQEGVKNIRTKKLIALVEKFASRSIENMNLDLYKETSRVLNRKQAPDDITMLCVDLGKEPAGQTTYVEEFDKVA